MQKSSSITGEAVAKPRADEWIDITVPIHDSMTSWPGLPHVSIMKFQDLHKGDETNITKFSMPALAGTHITTPHHVYKKGNNLNMICFDALIGNARVIEITNTSKITREELEKAEITSGERILLKTKNSDKDWTVRPFDKGFIALDIKAAKYLAELKIQTVGIDYLSIASKGIQKIIYSILFEAAITIIEGLNLAQVSASPCILNCLPLKILGAEGAPARALIKEYK